MRKNIMLASLCSFLLFLFLSYFFAVWSGKQEQKQEYSEANKPAMQQKNIIGEDTKMIYEYFYTADKVTKLQTEPAPDFLVGLDMAQLQSIYQGWQMVLFSPEKVILRCSIEGLSSETYLLGEQDGYLAIFYEDAQKKIHLKEKTQLPLSTLPEGEVRQIQEGMWVTGEENLAKILADFHS